jgi:tetratricopeptide (TPR) repeat protein
MTDYSKICFVIMPFGKKKIGKKKWFFQQYVDFDKIYKEIFVPAISGVTLPEGGKLIPKRADEGYYSGNIDDIMYEYLEYSRFALADITALNPNVFYELGARHHAFQSGTAIFRQSDQPIPFDISRIRAFPYDYQPLEAAKGSKDLITKVLTESLQYNKIDSPIWIALIAQKQMASDSMKEQQSRDTGAQPSLDKKLEAFQPSLEEILKKATNAARNNDFAKAADFYQAAIQLQPENPLLYLEAGLLSRKLENWDAAVTAFSKAVKYLPEYSEAWRELGIAENKVYNKKKDPALPTGEASLLEAIRLKNDDFDAYASLGGIYKRQGQFSKSLEMYDRSVEISNGHPYPLLNAVILQVKEKGVASITGQQHRYMEKAEIPLKKQLEDNPPYNAPWCFFDLSMIYLFIGQVEEARNVLKKGFKYSEGWGIKTHLETVKLIEGRKDELPGLADIIDILQKAL